jgi:protein TonB
MERRARRSYSQPSRAGRFLLWSLLLHLLVVVTLTLPRPLSEELPTASKEQPPMRVSFVRPESAEEPEKPETFAETSSRAQTPEEPTAEAAKSPETILPREQQLPLAPITASEPEAEPEVATKRPSAATSRQEPAKVLPPKPSRGPVESPEAKPRAKPTERTPKHPALEQAPAEPSEPKRLAKLPEPAERRPRRPAAEPISPSPPVVESPVPPGQATSPRFGRIPLLSGEDLEKYAQVRSSNQHSSSGGAVSLDTKELKYLSYFAHIKRRIERVWTYPQEAIANGTQGQLHLKFVLRRDGQIKTVELLRSSGYKVLDKEAWNAVATAGPFESFPPTIPDDELHITARFSYVLDEAVQRTRMR